MAIIPPDQVTGLILAGGESRRFGADKASALLGGRPFLERVAEALGPNVREILVAAGAGVTGASSPLRQVADSAAGIGPLAGLEAGFRAAATPIVFVAACDYPLLAPADVARVLGALGDAAVAMPLAAGRAHPLCAAWRRQEAGAALAAWLSSGRRDVTGLASSLGAVELPVDPADEAGYTNVNTPRDLARLADGIAGEAQR